MANTVEKYNPGDPFIGKRQEDIALILKLLENRLDELKQDIFLSKELLPDGIKTNLVNHIEMTIDNPFSQLLFLREKLDNDLKEFSRDIIKALLKSKKNIINEVFRCEDFESETLYCIELKKDTFEHRESVLELLDVYESLLANNPCPVNFQFIPCNKTVELRYIEEIHL